MSDFADIYMNRTRLIAFRRDPWFGGIGIYLEHLHIEDGVATRSMGVKVEMQKIKEGADFPAPLVELNESGAQELMDGLYRAGFRPSDAPKIGEQVAPTMRHLADMRKLVAHAYKVELPK